VLADFTFGVLVAALFIKPGQPIPDAVGGLTLLGLALALMTLVLYVQAERASPPEQRPLLSCFALIGWVSVFVVGLGPFGTPPPWWSGPQPESWLSAWYAASAPQLVGLLIALRGVATLSARNRRPRANRGRR